MSIYRPLSYPFRSHEFIDFYFICLMFQTKPTSDAAKKPGTGTGTEKPATGRPGSGTAARTATASAKSTAATKSLAKVN